MRNATQDRKNLEGDLQAKSVAAKAGYTKWHFQRRFKAITGYSLSQYDLLCRIVSATPDILGMDGLFYGHSFSRGFNSQQTFSSAVRKFFNMTPRDLRETLRI